MLTKTYTLTRLAIALVSLSGLLLSAPGSALAPLDSIGITLVNNQQFVLHKVDAGETLGALATRYRTSEESIKQANNGLAQGIQANQIVMVPFVPNVPKATHLVQPKETLYGISKMYGMTIAELKQLNNITTDGVQVGQTLTVKAQAAAVATNPNTMAAAAPAPTNANAPATNPYDVPAGTAPATTNAPAINTAPATTQAVAATPALGPIVRKTPKNYLVQPKETTYGLSKTFGVPVDSLVIWNNNQTGFKVGQIIVSGYNYYDANSNLILSSGYPAASTAAMNNPAAPATNVPATNTPAVDPYNQPAATNPAQQPAVDPYNQPAAVNQPAVDPYNQPAATAPAQQPAATPGQLPAANTYNQAAADVPATAQPTATAPTATAPATTSQQLAAAQPTGVASSFGQVPSYQREEGVGAMIKANSNSDNPNVFVALHRTAPYGTVIKVTNPSSNTSTVVKVIGTISNEIPADKNIIIKLSIATCRQLGILTEQFPIVIEYSK